ncbi:MAG: hypothetical protein K8F52_18855 [Candidatus Scalindua rubra]|uniref:Uncharacterized protein n=1 Tax=Candidatus Scalindua brodae TaxID=237368 RepID=A0A0B0EN12_9BACT|nr:MAG: hypothetical protein SCABRO_00889 [Candidatus Scalindua brodae]MBZ0110719.1 hypothetical protein [Candidatus Scalindua rubra]
MIQEIGYFVKNDIMKSNYMFMREKRQRTFLWRLFTIIVFGPCVPLIPLLIYPAAENIALVLVTSLFGVVTIATMLSIVIPLSLGEGIKSV